MKSSPIFLLSKHCHGRDINRNVAPYRVKEETIMGKQHLFSSRASTQVQKRRLLIECK